MTENPGLPRWSPIRRQLQEQKARLYAEIEGYPTPIPACDQHFNFLLEERARVTRDLQQLEAAQQGQVTAGEAEKILQGLARVYGVESGTAADNG